MPRSARQTPGGYVSHALNRATARLKLFRKAVALATDWLQLVNESQTEAELEAMCQSVARGRPYGSDAWVQAVVQRLGLQSTIRPRGRQRKQQTDTLNAG